MNKLLIIVLTILNLLAPNINAEEQENYNDLSIIMPSYDKYSELWEPTLTLLFKNWPNLNNKLKNIPFYLISNFEKFEHPRITNILVGDLDKGWSNNFLKALENVKTKYVLIILDDYIITDPVDDARLAQVLKLMRKTNGAYAEIKDDPSLIDGPEVPGYPGIITRSRFGPYRTSLQTCIWETAVLKWIIKPDENIWDFEGRGTHRSEGVMQPFYLTTDKFVFRYLNAVEKGRYYKSVVEYINKQGIKFSPTKLPIDESK